MSKRPVLSESSKKLQSLGQLLEKFDWKKDRFVSREFQMYGYKLAEELGDLAHKSMYIKFAKEIPRPALEAARNFVKDAGKVRSRARLFMWKLKQLRKGVTMGPVSEQPQK